MNELAAEWLQKAEGDYATAGRETRARRHPNYDAACFHAQQAAEKYLKAFLQEYNLLFPRTHSLIELLELCLPLDASFEPSCMARPPASHLRKRYVTGSTSAMLWTSIAKRPLCGTMCARTKWIRRSTGGPNASPIYAATSRLADLKLRRQTRQGALGSNPLERVWCISRRIHPMASFDIPYHG